MPENIGGQSLDEGLDHKAMEACAGWHFKPGTLDRQAVRVAVSIDQFSALGRPAIFLVAALTVAGQSPVPGRSSHGSRRGSIPQPACFWISVVSSANSAASTGFSACSPRSTPYRAGGLPLGRRVRRPVGRRRRGDAEAPATGDVGGILIRNQAILRAFPSGRPTRSASWALVSCATTSSSSTTAPRASTHGKSSSLGAAFISLTMRHLPFANVDLQFLTVAVIASVWWWIRRLGVLAPAFVESSRIAVAARIMRQPSTRPPARPLVYRPLPLDLDRSRSGSALLETPIAASMTAFEQAFFASSPWPSTWSCAYALRQQTVRTRQSFDAGGVAFRQRAIAPL